MTDNSILLTTIGGVILVQKNTENRLYCIEDLAYSTELSIGQIFNAVKVLYGKEPLDYGTLWPKFHDNNGNLSKQYIYIKDAFDKCTNDQEKFFLACDQLQEERPPIIKKEDVQKQLDVLKQIITQ